MENPFEIIVEKLTAIEKRLEAVESNFDYNIETSRVAEIMTLKQLSDYSSISKSFIYKLTSPRKIPHSKRGKRLYFSKSEIDEWLLKEKIRTIDDLQREATNYLVRKIK
ncbi:MAG: helix-turn-helix domain-containing protein [Flavobacteriaceae bacterium]|nr:helix-turn-helix domain-containing protein [Flavobacteriaceae bacterium]